jgi:DNA (cytosine-5)-methyltransferase 1
MHFVDLFCGCGGLTAGFVDAGWTPVLAIDADHDSAETYRRNFGDVVVHADVRDVVFRGVDADALVAGVPCQGFVPLARRNKKRDDRNGLFREALRALHQIRPDRFVIENVPGFMDWWSGKALVRGARKLGYDVEAKVLDAANYGIPQHRKRAIILGSLNDGISWPSPVDADRTKTVRNAIGDLPFDISWRGMNRTTRCGEDVLERIQHVPPGGSRNDLPKRLLLPCWKDHKTGSADVMGRLRWDAPSVSIRTEFIKPEKGRYIHPEADRPITLREGARLQSFRDGFRFHGSMTSVARQIGNAVPPLLAQKIAGVLGN